MDSIAWKLICNRVQKGKHTIRAISRRGGLGNSLLVGFPFRMGALLPTDESLSDSAAVIDIGHYPAALQALGNVGGDTTPGERIADEISRVGGQFYDPLKNDGCQFIRGSVLVLPMPHWRDIIPNVRQIESFWIEVFLVSTVILDIFAAMAACLYGCSHEISVEDTRLFSLDVIQQSVMARR